MGSNSQEIQELATCAEVVEDEISSSVSTVNSAVSITESAMQDFERAGKNVDEIVSQVKQINEISSTNARSVEEIAAAAEHLNAMTNSLHGKLEVFRT